MLQWPSWFSGSLGRREVCAEAIENLWGERGVEISDCGRADVIVEDDGAGSRVDEGVNSIGDKVGPVVGIGRAKDLDPVLEVGRAFDDGNRFFCSFEVVTEFKSGMVVVSESELEILEVLWIGHRGIGAEGELDAEGAAIIVLVGLPSGGKNFAGVGIGLNFYRTNIESAPCEAGKATLFGAAGVGSACGIDGGRPRDGWHGQGRSAIVAEGSKEKICDAHLVASFNKVADIVAGTNQVAPQTKEVVGRGGRKGDDIQIIVCITRDDASGEFYSRFGRNSAACTEACVASSDFKIIVCDGAVIELSGPIFAIDRTSFVASEGAVGEASVNPCWKVFAVNATASSCAVKGLIIGDKAGDEGESRDKVINAGTCRINTVSPVA